MGAAAIQTIIGISIFVFLLFFITYLFTNIITYVIMLIDKNNKTFYKTTDLKGIGSIIIILVIIGVITWLLSIKNGQIHFL